MRNPKLKAGALLFAIVIAFVVALIASLTLLYYANHSYRIRLILNHERLVKDVESGIELAYSQDGESFPLDMEFQLDLFQDGNDTVHLLKKQWGVFEMIYAYANWQSDTVRRTALIGKIPTDSNAIYIPDKGFPLCLCGSTQITGNASIPNAGIRSVTIEGISYSGSHELVVGRKDISKDSLPRIDKQIFNKSINPEIYPYKVQFSEPVNIVSLILENSFGQPTVLITSDSLIELKSAQLSGNIIIHSSKAIKVKNNCQLKDVILYSPVIRFETNTHATLQAFANDSIIVGDSSFFKYPSVLSLTPDTSDKNLNSYVGLGSSVAFYGSIIGVSPMGIKTNPTLHISDSCVIKGSIYWDGTTRVKNSTIIGGLTTNSILLKTDRGTYGNYFYNTKIDILKRPSSFVDGNHINSTNKRIVKWMD